MKLISIITLLFICSEYTYGASDISLVSFVFERTVIRPNTEIPVVVRIWNAGLTDTEVTLEIALSDNLTLTKGTSKSKAIMTNLAFSEVSWSVQVPASGNIAANLCVIAGPGDTLKIQTSGIVITKYWEQKEFFLSAWSPPPAMQVAYDYYKGANFSNIYSIGLPFSTGVSLIKKNNMNCLVHIPETIPNYWIKLTGSNSTPPEVTDADLNAMDQTIATYKNEKSVIGYDLIDEPGANRFKNLGKVVSYLKEKDPTRLAYINIFGNTAEAWQMDAFDYYDYVYRFLCEVKPEMLSYDDYVFYTDHDDRFYYDNMEVVRNLAQRFDVPYTTIIQLIGTENPLAPQVNWRTPTPAEHRVLVYSAMAYGYTGIVWFHWQMSWGLTGYPADKEAEMYATVAQLNKEIKNLGIEILKLKSVGVYHVNDVPPGTKKLPADELVTNVDGNESFIVGLFKDSIQSDYFMVTNKNYKSDSQPTIRLKYILSKLEYFDVNTGQWVNISTFTVKNSGSEFQMPIAAGNGILFRPTWIYTGVSEITKQADENYLSNYPNPFKLGTTFKYGVSQDSEIELYITNLLGEKITVLEKTFRKRGEYAVNFDASNYFPGIYFYSLKSAKGTQTKTMIRSR